ncbi:gag/pol protein [Cucumis melo var. makuwa]|uniref:Gag/pol protein n=1 Tax=Cucumis melo var. makuwa TaxID=1194695 RepID=A0A5D3DID2_CUCMM|nr:gag/pol protein [Cucumis melo var. makuwa]TYK23396.1 gag/pol protein [Cucumis melo var. makuwa]
MMHFNIAEVNGDAIDEANHVSFILESLPKSFIPFQTNASLNKIEFNLTTLLNELQRFQNLTMDRKEGKEEDSQSEQGKEDYRKRIERLVKSGLLSQLEDNSLPPCDSCLEGKMSKRSFTGKGLRAKTSSELVNSDLCGSMNVKARGGYEYFISFIDDYSRSRWRVYGLAIPRLLDRTWNPIQLFAPSTSQQNGVSERRN